MIEQENIFSPERALRLPNLEPHGGYILTVRGTPSKPEADKLFRGMGFDLVGDKQKILCTISSESFKKAGYGPIKIPKIVAVLKLLEEDNIPLKVTGNYRAPLECLEVDYSKTLDYVCEALKELENEHINRACAKLMTTGNFQ